MSVGRLAAAVLLLALVATSVANARQLSAQPSVKAANCKVVGKGTSWSYHHQKGTAYTVEGNRASACALGLKWLVRLTTTRGVPKTPPGWQCITATAVAGQCENKGGAIFEWTAKLK